MADGDRAAAELKLYAQYLERLARLDDRLMMATICDDEPSTTIVATPNGQFRPCARCVIVVHAAAVGQAAAAALDCRPDDDAKFTHTTHRLAAKRDGNFKRARDVDAAARARRARAKSRR